MMALGRLVLPRIDKEGDDGLFAKRLGGLQPVQTLNKSAGLAPAGLCRVLAAISSIRLGSRVARRLVGT